MKEKEHVTENKTGIETGIEAYAKDESQIPCHV